MTNYLTASIEPQSDTLSISVLGTALAPSGLPATSRAFFTALASKGAEALHFWWFFL